MATKTTQKKTTARKRTTQKKTETASVTPENLPEIIHGIAIEATKKVADAIHAAGLVPVSGQNWNECPVSGKRDGSLKERIGARRAAQVSEVNPSGGYLNTVQRNIVQPWTTAGALVTAARLRIIAAMKAEAARKSRNDAANTDSAARDMIAGMARTLAEHVGADAAIAMLALQGFSPEEAASIINE